METSHDRRFSEKRIHVDIYSRRCRKPRFHVGFFDPTDATPAETAHRFAKQNGEAGDRIVVSFLDCSSFGGVWTYRVRDTIIGRGLEYVSRKGDLCPTP